MTNEHEEQGLAPVEPMPVGLSIAESPSEVVDREAEQARVLMDIVEQQRLYVDIRGKKYLTAEAWSTIGSFNGISPETEWVRPFRNDDEKIVGYEAKVNLVHVPTGRIRASGVMVCGFDDFSGRGKSGTAQVRSVQSTAQTWAMAKAYRQGYSRIAVLAGYSPTPAEEMRDALTVTTTPSTPSTPPNAAPSPTYTAKADFSDCLQKYKWSKEWVTSVLGMDIADWLKMDPAPRNDFEQNARWRSALDNCMEAHGQGVTLAENAADNADAEESAAHPPEPDDDPDLPW